MSEERKRLLDLTLKELEEIASVSLKDIFSVEGMSLNLSWSQVIKLVNHLAGEKVLSWDTTAKEAIEQMGIFL